MIANVLCEGIKISMKMWILWGELNVGTHF